MVSGFLTGEKLVGAHRGQRQQPCRSRKETLRVQAAGSTYGTNFRVTTFGESHGKSVGCIIDGVPPRLPITQEEIQVGIKFLAGLNP